MIFTDSEKLHRNFIQLIIYILCGLLELLIEPVIMHMNLHMENKFLPITISSISRVITNTIFVAIFKMDLWGFTLSRIIGTSVYISYLFWLGYFKYKLHFLNFIPKDIRKLIFAKITFNGINLLYLREILFQSIKLNLLNLVLSRCQNVVLSFVIKSSYEEKSDYSFILQNYGLITRFLLEPIIDAFYNLVNKIKYIEKNVDNNEIIKAIKKEKEDNKLRDNNNFDYNINDSITNNNNANVDKDIKTKEKEKNTIIKKGSNEMNASEVKIPGFKNKKKEINYELSIRLLQLFLKIFTYIGLLIIPYYLLIGTEVMGLVYGQKWQTNSIDKIGDCYSYCVIFMAVSELIKNFGNATNDTHQMNLSYLSLIINAAILTSFMYFLSKWDICGLILTNQLSSIFLINCNLYIVFYGKTMKNDLLTKDCLFYDIDNFIKKSFVTKISMFITAISILVGHFVKKSLLKNSEVIIKILGVGFIGLINASLIYLFEKKNFIEDLNFIKLY